MTEIKNKHVQLMQGNEACALGAIKAGTSFISKQKSGQCNEQLWQPIQAAGSATSALPSGRIFKTPFGQSAVQMPQPLQVLALRTTSNFFPKTPQPLFII